MRMIPSEQLETRSPRGRVSVPDILGSNRKPIPRRIVPLVFQRQDFNDIAMSIFFRAKERAAAFVRIRLCTMTANSSGHLLWNS